MKKSQIASDIYRKYGALLSISDIKKYCGISANTARRITKDLDIISHGTGKRYFYEDVAEAIMKY